ncbi:hypothetical protein JMQ84_000793 [Enterococcus hirae]|nr:hypothetical protein [Enterococcus hirae]
MNDPYIAKLEKLSKDFEKNKNKMTRYQLIELVNLVIRGAISREKALQNIEVLAHSIQDGLERKVKQNEQQTPQSSETQETRTKYSKSKV